MRSGDDPIRRQPLVREVDPASQEEVELVATRMRLTLVDVLGEDRGGSLYTLDWLRRRVRWHLNPSETTAAIFLAEASDGHVAGHTIVRIETEDAGRPFGLFSTFYVEPESRRQGIATALLLRGERWIRERGLTQAATNTGHTNQRLIGLLERHGYTILLRDSEMVRLGKTLA